MIIWETVRIGTFLVGTGVSSESMRPTHLDKGLTKLDHGFGADEEAINFGFGSRGHNKLDYLGDSENMVIYGRDRDVFYELYVGTSGAAGFSDIEVGSI